MMNTCLIVSLTGSYYEGYQLDDNWWHFYHTIELVGIL